MLPILGCCGWAGAQPAYFASFPSIEIQSTFYDPPSLKAAAKWRAMAPDGFVYCMKAWQLITHTPSSPTYRRLRVPVPDEDRDLLGSFRNSEPVWRAWERSREFATVLGAQVVVFQCPASFGPSAENAENLSRFFKRVGQQPFQLAWEPRGPWPPGLVHDLCAKHGLIHCVDPFVNLPLYGDILYWRLHGKGSYFYRYTDEDLAELARMLTAHQSGRESFLMFNNVPMKDDADRFRNLCASSSLCSF